MDQPGRRRFDRKAYIYNSQHKKGFREVMNLPPPGPSQKTPPRGSAFDALRDLWRKIIRMVQWR